MHASKWAKKRCNTSATLSLPKQSVRVNLNWDVLLGAGEAGLVIYSITLVSEILHVKHNFRKAPNTLGRISSCYPRGIGDNCFRLPILPETH